MTAKRQYVFGPVPSRRLGLSLGVDLVPMKTCTFDCVYCQLGPTTKKTVRRDEYAPLRKVIEELAERLETRPEPDYITLSGSGEPTLYSRLGEIVEAIKSLSNAPVAVLTNGSLLWKPEVRHALLKADLVIPSLDAGSKDTYRLVNRPHPAIGFESLVGGLAAFREEYKGGLWLEVMLLKGLTSASSEVAKIARVARRIAPDRVDLNTVVRPPAEGCARAVPEIELRLLAELFSPPANVVGEHSGRQRAANKRAAREQIGELLRRRPCTLDDLAQGLGAKPSEIVKHIESLNRLGVVIPTIREGKRYFVHVNAKDFAPHET